MHSYIPSTIRRYRNQRHLTLENVSGIAGMSVQHLSEIESSKRDPRLSVPGAMFCLAKLCLEQLVLFLLLLQKAARQGGLLCLAFWREPISVAALVVAAAHVFNLQQTLRNQCFDEEVGSAQAHAQGLGHIALHNGRLRLNQTHQLEMRPVVPACVLDHDQKFTPQPLLAAPPLPC